MFSYHSKLATAGSAAIGNAYKDSNHGTGSELWMRTEPGDLNATIQCRNNFLPIQVAGYAAGVALEITSKQKGSPVGVVYPLKRNNKPLVDGALVSRVDIVQQVATYENYPNTVDIMRYRAQLYSADHEDGKSPVAVIETIPIARLGANQKLYVAGYITKPKLDTTWYTPHDGKSDGVTVTDDHVKLATSSNGIAPWDQHLLCVLEVAIYKLKLGEMIGVARM